MLDLRSMRNVLGVILAGGAGERLQPLTLHRAKPSVRFGGMYRLIDFTLSNCVNSQCRKVMVLVQYKCLSLTRHIRSGWNLLHPELGEFIEVIPAQKRVGESWYRGTADAIYQNLYSILPENPELILVLAGDHVYKMDYSKMVAFHRRNHADITVAAIEMPVSEAKRFGVLEVDYDARIIGFEEKPNIPLSVPDNPEVALASMGIYVFSTKVLKDACQEDASRMTSHDFGKDIIPPMVNSGRVFAYLFQDENKKNYQYWRDVGTLDSYWEAHMDLVDVDPILDLYDTSWPIRTRPCVAAPAKFVFNSPGERMGTAVDSIVSPGCIVSGGLVERSVLAPEVFIHSYSHLQESIVMRGAHVGRNARIRRAIIEKNVHVPPGAVIGYDQEADQRRFHVSANGIVVVDDDERFDTEQALAK
jgi:glucose-1-phosphate adenylyltransferase